MKDYYMVFDWDNTIRRGYTLFSWMDFLYENSVLNKNNQKNIIEIQEEYSNKRINHDEYAEKACKIYAAAMKGISDKKKELLIRQYIEYDEKYLYPFSYNIFNFLNKYGIKSIVISGAPFCVLKEYKEKFNLYEIYAFQEKTVNGICTGDVECNHGLNKREKLEEIIKKFGHHPIASFGDSDSDIPLFDMSQYAFCVINKDIEKRNLKQNIIYINSDMSGEQIQKILYKVLN